jgi:hypothetical protein
MQTLLGIKCYEYVEFWVTNIDNESYRDHCMEHEIYGDSVFLIIWGAISHNWMSPLIFLESAGKDRIQVEDYYEPVLEPVVSLAFSG